MWFIGPSLPQNIFSCLVECIQMRESDERTVSRAWSWSLQGIAVLWLWLALALSVIVGALEGRQSLFSAIGWDCHMQGGVFSDSPSNLVRQLGGVP